jgi:hypothetical protein
VYACGIVAQAVVSEAGARMEVDEQTDNVTGLTEIFFALDTTWAVTSLKMALRVVGSSSGLHWREAAEVIIN